jgi:putative membrane protein
VDLNGTLALTDVVFTSASLACMLRGYAAIRRHDVKTHRRWMLRALAASALFAVSFVIRYARFGRSPFARQGAIRGFYLAVWFTHEPIAVVSVPLVLAAATLGLRRAFGAHREVASLAFPVWVYASVTGVLVYLLVYVLPLFR